MDQEKLLSFEWTMMMPEFIILGVIGIIILLDLIMPKNMSRKILGWFGFAGIVLAIVSLVGLLPHDSVSILYETFRLDSFAKAFKMILLVGAALVMLLAINYQPREGVTEYRSEFFCLFLTALLGAMIITSSGDLITLFIGLELLSLSTYILAGLRKQMTQSNEAAMKYVVNGGISTAVTLFGMSYVYGLTGTTNIMDMRNVLIGMTDSESIYLLGIAFLMIFVGLSFKIAAAPFHMWAPDVYQGSPTPVTAFLSVVSKSAGFVLLVRILLSIFAQGPHPTSILLTFENYIAFIAGTTIVIGNVIALKQHNIKRLFAYSSIAHSGYLLVAIASLSIFMFDSLWFYLITYVFMNIGVFAVIQLLSSKEGLDDLDGLYHRAPYVAIGMALFLLSLAGIPGTAGFIGKLNIITGAFVRDDPHYILLSVMIVATIVSYIYYFHIMVRMFFRPSKNKGKVDVSIGTGVVITICVAATILFGVFPNLLFEFLQTNFFEFGDFLQ